MRAELCSGPWPSKPWGSSRARPEVCPHLSSAAAMYWSMMICAPLTKSPNCASQQHERVLVRHGVAVLEAHGGVLGQQRVVDPELALLRAQVGERRVLGARLVVDLHRVTLRERASARVLTGESDVRALEQERSERHRLGQGPVDLAGFEHLGPRVELLGQLRVDVEPVGQIGHRRVNLSGSSLDTPSRHGAARRPPVGAAWPAPHPRAAIHASRRVRACRRGWKSSSACSASSIGCRRASPAPPCTACGPNAWRRSACT